MVSEETSRKEYTTYMHQLGHTGLTVSTSGLNISDESPWLAASPDGLVLDPSYTPVEGLIESKNPSLILFTSFFLAAAAALLLNHRVTMYI